MKIGNFARFFDDFDLGFKSQKGKIQITLDGDRGGKAGGVDHLSPIIVLLSHFIINQGLNSEIGWSI